MPYAIDLFCGAGGMSEGLIQAGFHILFSSDINPDVQRTYMNRHEQLGLHQGVNTYFHRGDIREFTGNLINENIGNLEIFRNRDVPEIDAVFGGPPCQGFSMANRQRLIDDPRNHLYKSYVEVVKKVHPKFFVMENVKGMLSVAEQVKEDFRAIGYSVECHILNAKNFGVPQNRERLIYIGNCLGVDNEQIFNEIFALSENIPEHNLGNALFALRELEASRVKNSTESGSIESGYKIEKNSITETNDYISYINQDRVVNVVSNHKARYNNDRDIEIYGRMEPGDRSDDPKIADIMPYARRNGIFKDKYFKLENDKVCKTITAHMKFDCNMYIHPTQARGLTPREAARVQSYPDDYFFRGAYTKTYMQIGNSVPPLLGRAIAHVIKSYMKGGND